MTRKQLIYLAILMCSISAVLGYVVSNHIQEPEVRTVTVTEVQERESVVTRIKERPDGTKETVIIENRDKRSQSSSEHSKRALKKWRAGAAIGARINSLPTPTYGLRVERRVLGDLFLGAYGRTDGELGLSLSLSF